MCAEAGTVIAIGPLEFEHTADIVRGMSGGPVVDADCRLVGLCQKGRKLAARQNGVELPSDSRFLRTRRFATMLHNINWSRQPRYFKLSRHWLFTLKAGLTLDSDTW